MKRLMACILALMLVLTFGAASAEQAIHTGIAVEANADQLGLFLTAIGLGEADARRMAGMFADFFRILGIDCYVSDDDPADQAQFILSLSDEAIVRAAIQTDDDGHTLQAASNLLPNAVIALPLAGSGTAFGQHALAQIPADEWLAFMTKVSEERDQWFVNLPSETQTGFFMGDAYTGGTNCITYTFNDRDAAVFGLAVLSHLEDTVNQHAGDESDEINSVFWSLRSGLNMMMQKNAHRYVLRSISDRDGKDVGKSLTVFRGEEQIATFSVGYENGQMKRLVIGFGYRNQVYYADCVPGSFESTETGLTFTADLLIYRDPYKLGFAAASQREENILAAVHLNPLYLQVSTASSLLEYTVSLEMPGKPVITETTKWISKGGLLSVQSAVAFQDETIPILKVMLSQDRSEMPVYEWPADTQVLNPETDAEQIEAILRSGIAGLAADLIRLAPPSFLTLFAD